MVGADRIAANGDIANKIGTYGAGARRPRARRSALRARAHLDRRSGHPGRSRDSHRAAGRERGHRLARPVAPPPTGCEVWNPAFDVTPAELVTAIVTDRGVLAPRCSWLATHSTDALHPRPRPGNHRLYRTRRPPGRHGARPRRIASSPSTSRSPAGSSTTRRKSSASRVEAMRGGRQHAGERPVGLGITNQRETVVLWDRRTLAPVAPAIVWQDRRTSDRCRELRDAGLEPMLRERTGLVADPYFSATKLEWLLRDPELRRRAAARASSPAGTVDSWLVARLTGGRVHVSDHTNASRTLLYDLRARDWDPELLAHLRRPARSCCPPSSPRPAWSGRPMPRTSAFRCRSPGSPATSRPRCSARDAATPDWPRTPTAPAPFSWCYAGDRVAASAGWRPCHRGLRSAGRAGLRARGQRLRRRRGGPVASGRARAHRARRGDRGAGAERAGYRRRLLRPRLCGAGHAALGAGGAGHDHRSHPRNHPGPPGARGAGSDRVQQRRAARGNGWRTAGSRCPRCGWTAVRPPTTG